MVSLDPNIDLTVLHVQLCDKRFMKSCNLMEKQNEKILGYVDGLHHLFRKDESIRVWRHLSHTDRYHINPSIT